eukprot:scaffold127521_cov36-Tisochrysis_lutea.AAC.2
MQHPHAALPHNNINAQGHTTQTIRSRPRRRKCKHDDTHRLPNLSAGSAALPFYLAWTSRRFLSVDLAIVNSHYSEPGMFKWSDIGIR